ncbi:hypothetical protein FE840_000625 [Peteryoungia desertarenae]|uniref:Uncharacterized protein n=1 Tax=Peteryoungia desertarenae TaxID=1813451 RepID=A0ABX6QI59_9HYPH|nr:hypothetical protein [Peteryoungia desertarenae]QLF68184.1 hypothetical protein FE840_000625 [Peteryoungia desertarenae]
MRYAGRYFWAAIFTAFLAYSYYKYTYLLSISEVVRPWLFEVETGAWSQDFLRDSFVNLVSALVQVALTTFFVSIVFSRKKRNEEKRAKKYIASSLRDEIFEYIVASDPVDKEKRFSRVEMLCERAESALQTHEWSLADRFRDALVDHRSDPANKSLQAIIGIRFRHLVERLHVRGTELDAFCDRVDKAFLYQGGLSK